jgi:hypothetical protein
MPIDFFRETEDHGYLSNFSPHAVTLKGKTWPTTEHYYQAQKHAGTPLEEEVRLAPTPLAAKELASDPARGIRTDWEEVKVPVMREAVLAKFEQHADLREALLATGDEELVERSPDAYWGSGLDGKGLNWLGRILMEVRQKVREGARAEGAGGAAPDAGTR